jgi:homoprotocatechuate degradation regulator HpaR
LDVICQAGLWVESRVALWQSKSMSQKLPVIPPAPRATKASLPMSLLRAREAVMSHFRPMLDRHGVNEQQWRVIRVLAEAGELDASEVAERANILAPSLTRMIKALTERGLIVKARDEGDGRRVILTIAPAGIDLLRKVSPDSAQIYDDLEARFGRERVEELLRLLDELTKLKA